jgi:hypothetical protein
MRTSPHHRTGHETRPAAPESSRADLRHAAIQGMEGRGGSQGRRALPGPAVPQPAATDAPVRRSHHGTPRRRRGIRLVEWHGTMWQLPFPQDGSGARAPHGHPMIGPGDRPWNGRGSATMPGCRGRETAWPSCREKIPLYEIGPRQLAPITHCNHVAYDEIEIAENHDG